MTDISLIYLMFSVSAVDKVVKMKKLHEVSKLLAAGVKTGGRAAPSPCRLPQQQQQHGGAAELRPPPYTNTHTHFSPSPSPPVCQQVPSSHTLTHSYAHSCWSPPPGRPAAQRGPPHRGLLRDYAQKSLRSATTATQTDTQQAA